MTERPYPEAIRGCWYLLGAEQLPEQARRAGTYEIYTFHIDGTYAQWAYRGGQLKQSGRGDYTFDGDFLITRGRVTETYRVTMKAHDLWEIEAKKGPRALTRTLNRARVQMNEAQIKDLRILPLKARGEAMISHALSPLEVIYEGERIALVSIDRWTAQKVCWLGYYALAEGLSEAIWQRIMRESIFATQIEEPEAFERLEVQRLDQPDAVIHAFAL